ncbi:hypothetical protein [Sphingomonas japonica]|uniref:Uncharacterized protein n=1 Tax=Sphingomonas japonica TaxID=511662 RepID=A0ABX0U4I0_9SPHN|nr:hypothetical protein [Sphingomonas japonica]NIJ24207.1 hypothetical protein [Sphingomonas japonica]
MLIQINPAPEAVDLLDRIAGCRDTADQLRYFEIAAHLDLAYHRLSAWLVEQGKEALHTN